MQDLEQAQLEKAFELGQEDALGDIKTDLTFEQYRLVLMHEFISSNGKRSLIETPIEVTYATDRMPGSTKPIVVNQMIDTLKHFMLEKCMEEK
jgi:hypothetical protein